MDTTETNRTPAHLAEREVNCTCGAVTITRHPTQTMKMCVTCLDAARRVRDRRNHTARRARLLEQYGDRAARYMEELETMRTTTTAGRLAAVEARRISRVRKHYDKTGKCLECCELPHRRPLDGCQVCGGAYQAPPGRQMTDRLYQSAAGCIV